MKQFTKKSPLVIALIALSMLFTGFNSKAQCLQIESILVDACVPGGGCVSNASPNCSCEGKNEMVLFKVLGAPLTIASLVPTWPNNTFKGWKQNALTAANVATLNATIIKCGYLKKNNKCVL